MVVTDEDVDTAVHYLAEAPHPLALAHLDYLRAKSQLRHRRAELYISIKGTKDEREARIELDNEYGSFLYEMEEAFFRLEDHKQRVDSSKTIIEIWRTQKADARAVERVR